MGSSGAAAGAAAAGLLAIRGGGPGTMAAGERRHNLLVDAAWVEDLLRAGPTRDGRPYVLLEVLFTGEGAEAHGEKAGLSPRWRQCLPGAVSVHPSYFEAELDTAKYYPRYDCPEDGNLLPDDRLCAAIARLGIRADTMVVVYGKGVVSTMAACRAVWALMYAGVEDVRLLDGGFAAWERHGGRLSRRPTAPRAVEWTSGHCCKAAYLATSEEVAAVARQDSPGVIVDVRKLGEYEGWLKDNYGFFSEAGHIPSALYQGNWDELVDMETEKLRSVADVASRWDALGISSLAGPVIFYCGTGWRSSVAFVLAYMMGWDTKNYDGGWYEWSVGLEDSDCRVCRPGCGCAIVKNDKGFTIKALDDSLMQTLGHQCDCEGSRVGKAVQSPPCNELSADQVEQSPAFGDHGSQAVFL